MEARKPFTFDHSFDSAAMEAEAEKKTAPAFSEADMAAAKEAAFQQGLVEGRAAAAKEVNEQQAIMLQHMEKLLGHLAGDLLKTFSEQRQAATDIALTIARQLVPEYVKKHGLQELTSAVEHCVVEMIHEPRLVLRVPDAQFDFMSKEVAGMAERLGYAGKMIVLADNTLGEHDCRIEWPDGGMEKNMSFTWSEIERQVSRHGPITPSAPVQVPPVIPPPPPEAPPSHTTNIAV
jgi:flagellar assembly protein FliH